jgi:pimeloyl-ACP methyl ester carboxylesterase
MEAEFLARLNAAEVDEFAEILTRATAEEERVLVEYLGEQRFERMRDMALSRRPERGTARARGNVVVLHGIMGAELSSVDRAGALERVWLQTLGLLGGKVERLRLSADGRVELDRRWDVRASGILKRSYGELLLALSADWQVRAFWYDWRKDLETAAADFEAKLRGWFGDAPVHLVAHSMGGLVARTFIAEYPDHWEAMWDPDEGRRGGRLVMLGTPNRGSYAIPQVMTGLERIVRRLALVDLRHSKQELLEILNSFVGTFQMLPAPGTSAAADALYRLETWGDRNISRAHLERAKAHHERLATVVDPKRMVYVAGSNHATLAGVDPGRIGDSKAYKVTLDGDGRVTHELGVLEGVQTYYTDADHGGLTAHRAVLSALPELLTTGRTDKLPATADAFRGRAAPAPDELAADEALAEEQLRQLIALAPADDSRALPGQAGSRQLGTREQRAIETTIVDGLLAGEEPDRDTRVEVPFEPARIRIRLVGGRIEEIHDRKGLGPDAVDVLAVGHYLEVVPQAAELALDRAVSGARKQTPASELLLTRLTLRGILRGRLGEPFFMPDPRDQARKRLVAIAGMGEPGRFGVPELTVLARELSWSLGHMGRRHLATVVIGAGNGNLSPEDAVLGWIRGIRNGITGSDETRAPQLRQVTFVEEDPRRITDLHRSLTEITTRLTEAKRLTVDYELLEDLDDVAKRARARAIKELGRGEGRAPDDAPPTRVTATADPEGYLFGAITDSAAVPERRIALQRELVEQANDDLAAAPDPRTQLEQGDYLRKLLLPRDIVRVFESRAPLVMLLDSRTARLHWEMIAQPDPVGVGAGTGTGLASADVVEAFLGTARGLTRQLRTQFAPPPEPPPPPRRLLRVLVIADPARDAPLKGAMEEGAEVANLLESFNEVHAEQGNRIEVVRLLGPRQATRTNVLRTLMGRTFDVVHYAGHCVYDVAEPSRSGWVFSVAPDERVTTNELSRVDRVPKFVVSNACESGITSDSPRDATTGLAPGFAEAFFDRGVSNFVCTAWPVNDLAAREFASVLYSRLLGLPLPTEDPQARRDPMPMHSAMRDARQAIAPKSYGALTWGAYQHYGNPHFRLFEPFTRDGG